MLLFAGLANATLLPLWSDAGWPKSHEGNAFAHRTYVYARHFTWLDVVPIWSSIDVSGFGSPMPLLYHKVFYVPAALLFLATGSLKAADATTIALLLMVGAIGLALTMRVLGATRLAAAVAGCCLIAANYTVTNWLVRGALAEFCGAMIVPWLLLFFVKTIQSGRLHIGVGITLALLWLSHSVLAYYAGMILAATYLLLAVLRRASLSVLRPATAWPPVVSFMLLVAPWLVPMTIIGANYDMTRILTEPYHPLYQFRPFSAYLWETRWRFGSTASGLTTQLDHAMIVVLAIALGAMAVSAPRSPNRSRRDLLGAAAPFLAVVSFGLILQLPATAPFYERVPGAAFIQFPWRLLALITPALIVAALYLADQVLPAGGRHFLLGGAAMAMVLGCGAFVPLRDSRIALSPPGGRVTFSGFREYEPKTAAPLAELQEAIAVRWRDAGCSYARLDHDEVPTVRFDTACPSSTVLPLPLYATPMHVVRAAHIDRGHPCLLLPELPGVCGAAIPASSGVVAVDLPDMAAFVRWMWRRYVVRTGNAFESEARSG